MSKQSSGTHLFTPTKMANLTSGEKLARIRQLLAAHDLEGYLITSADAHQVGAIVFFLSPALE